MEDHLEVEIPQDQPLAARPDGETPETAIPADDIPKRPIRQRVNFVLHEAVQRLMIAGLWVDLGPKLGNARFRLRPFHMGPVVAKIQSEERRLRVSLSLNDGEEIPAERQIEVTRAAVLMAITEAEGSWQVNGDPGMVSQDPNILAGIQGGRQALVAARDLGFKITEEDGLTFIEFERLPKSTPSTANPVNAKDRAMREDHANNLRKVLKPLLESSITLMTQLFKTSKALQGVKEEEIFRLGEDYVYGAAEASDWHD